MMAARVSDHVLFQEIMEGRSPLRVDLPSVLRVYPNTMLITKPTKVDIRVLGAEAETTALHHLELFRDLPINSWMDHRKDSMICPEADPVAVMVHTAINTQIAARLQWINFPTNLVNSTPTFLPTLVRIMETIIGPSDLRLCRVP